MAVVSSRAPLAKWKMFDLSLIKVLKEEKKSPLTKEKAMTQTDTLREMPQ